VLGAPPEYFPLVREICDEHDVLLIIDEVITGWGRTGANFAIDHWDVVPDMICTGKGIASGYTPLAATIVHERVVDTIEPSGVSVAGYTYAANPLSCAVGDTVLAYVTDQGLVERSAEVGAEMHERAQRLLDLPIVGVLRGKGMILGVEYVADKEIREPFAPEQAVCQRIGELAQEQGLLTYAMTGVADGYSGDASVLKPPLTTPRDDVMAMVDILEGAILEFQEQLRIP
jgi:adenosylmethionine-8-amino-7-oxononanoate aminotransferase